ncbi:MAG: leucyl aminopeptidase [SAR116 cluster bacterium]|nr:leucyl aminopeptidase [SAR116 cluster bacterium]
MELNLQFTVSDTKELLFKKNELYIFVVQPKIEISPNLKKVQNKSKTDIKTILDNSNFKAKFGENLLIRSSNQPFLLFGCGDLIYTNSNFEKLGGILFSTIKDLGFKTVSIISDLKISSAKEKKLISKMLFGIKSKSYEFKKYKNSNISENKINLKFIKIYTKNQSFIQKQIQINNHILDGIFLAKDLTSEPANILTTEEFVNQIKGFSEIGIEVEILDEDQMTKLGMNALLGVGRGSKSKSYLGIMKWNGNKKEKKNIAFVGKGVCFDSGGLSLKSGRGMMDMKEDMGGAGIVVGAMKSIALQKLKTNIVGVVGLVENMPDANAQRPGDIIRSMSGKTIEVLNTDAEGRLVLADALYYTNKKYKPKFIVDLATLTGAIISALGNERAGLFSNDDNLSNSIFDIGEETGDLVWKMPLDKVYGTKMKSSIADLKNIGTAEGSSIQAASFLKNFIGTTPWAHLDVAGVVWKNNQTELHSGGATGWGVKLLFEVAKRQNI